MTTIVNPSGTPTIVYNRNGTTIATISASGTTAASATVISIFSEKTLVLVNTTPSDSAVQLPDDAEVGDIVEVLNNGAAANSVFVFPPSGQSLTDPGEGGLVTKAQYTSNASFMLVAANAWIARWVR